MAFCPNCGAQIPDGAPVCPNCGTALGGAAYVDPTDHTAEFTAQDISDNKVFAMASILISSIGIIITLLAAQKSEYAMFYARQALKLMICQVLCLLLFIIPILGWIAGGICLLVIFVLKVICFFNICKGKAKEVPIVNGFGFLK